MRNKVLIVSSNIPERTWFEGVLQEIVEHGGELFFAEKADAGLAILKREQPQLVFLDAAFVEKSELNWEATGAHIVLLGHPKTATLLKWDLLTKPLKRDQVLERCRRTLHKEHLSPSPPM